MNTDDNTYNVLQIHRYPVETTLSAKDSTQEAGGNYYERHKGYEFTAAVRAIERAFIWGDRPSGTGNTNTTTNLGSVPTSRGLYEMAQSTYPFNGSMTFEKIVENLPNAMHNSMDYNKQYLWFMSKRAVARLIGLMQNNAYTWRESSGNIYEKWGIKALTLVTAGPEITFVAHDAFNYGSDQARGLILLPEDIDYYYKNGSPPMGKSGKGGAPNRDISIVQNIEANSADKKKDEIFAEVGLLERTGGYNLMTTTEMLPL